MSGFGYKPPLSDNHHQISGGPTDDDRNLMGTVRVLAYGLAMLFLIGGLYRIRTAHGTGETTTGIVVASLGGIFTLRMIYKIFNVIRQHHRLLRDRCIHCGYPHLGLNSARCPECGGDPVGMSQPDRR